MSRTFENAISISVIFLISGDVFQNAEHLWVASSLLSYTSVGRFSFMQRTVPKKPEVLRQKHTLDFNSEDYKKVKYRCINLSEKSGCTALSGLVPSGQSLMKYEASLMYSLMNGPVNHNGSV